MIPRSMRPVTTVPRPLIENTSSTAIRNGLSMSRCGSGMWLSTASIRFATDSTHFSSPLSAPSAEPWITGMLSPSYSYFDRSSRTSISTSSSKSGSSTASHLFMNTTIVGTPTWRAKSTCSLVCGIGPSTPLTTRIAPSICAAPVIMFLT